jgi:ribonucleotide reductase alpha subunit
MNLFIASPTVGSVNSMHFYAWQKGLKTGMYYLRSKPASNAKAITVEDKHGDADDVVRSTENPEECQVCSA